MKPFLLVALFFSSVLLCNAQLKVGDRAPIIAAKSWENNSFNIQDYSGKYLLIDVWASWCGPCIKAFKTVKKLYKTAPKDSFEIIGISIDNSEDTWRTTVNNQQLPWVQFHSPGNYKSPMVNHWKVEMIPATFLVNPQGIIEMIDPSPKELKKFLSKLK